MNWAFVKLNDFEGWKEPLLILKDSIMSMEKVNLVELAKHIVSLQRDIFAEISRSGKINPEKATLLADCRDYCFYLVLDILEEESEDVTEIVEQLMKCEAYASGKGDRFHNGFFFTLSQLLAIKYKVRLLRGYAINREDFKESWLRTREELRV